MHRKKNSSNTQRSTVMPAGTIEVLANEISNQTISVESQTNENLTNYEYRVTNK